MIKIIGALIITGATSLLGIYKSVGLKNRVLYLCEFKTALSLLKSEIVFAGNCLEKAFMNISKTSRASWVFETAAKNIDGCGVKKAWENSVLMYADKMSLKNEDVKVLQLLGAQLGMTDKENQIKNIVYVSELVDSRIRKAEQEYLSTAKLYRSMGVLSGLFISVVLI